MSHRHLLFLVPFIALACRTSPKADGDTAGLAGTDTEDADGDGSPAGTDCDDTNAAVGPDVAEVCNGIDDNCNGEVDEGVLIDFYDDGDGDGFGAGEATAACAPPEGHVVNAEDCDDDNPAVYPDAEELCDGIDNNCDGNTDDGTTLTLFADVDGDGYGDPLAPSESCEEGPGLVADSTDCDDMDPAIHPGADEVCNERDDDCDTDVDEDVTRTFYVDADSDGWGDAGATTDACEVPDGYAPAPGDCDDGVAAVNPDATELCNSIDDNCDGHIDEASAADAATWFADTDTDGFGDSTNTTTACTQPSGHTADNTDCDDAVAAVNPDATEVCNGVDDDCDGDTDDGDTSVDLSTATDWSADGDGDGYGDASTTTRSCTSPTGHVADNTDCDDLDPAINPGASEICNTLDDDCDGDIDDDDASLDTSTASTWYADTDGDGHGDLAVTALTCVAPAGYGTDSTDCDDTDALTSPSAHELWDAEDNDCDGSIDEELYKGSGIDGALSVSTDTELGTDAVAFDVTSISGNTVVVSSTATGLAPGDEVVLINLQGTDGAHAGVGAYEHGSVDTVSGATVTLRQSVAQTYGESSNSDLSGQIIVLQRVPHYTDVTVATTGTLSSPSWADGGTGIVAFRATGTVDFAAGGSIVADSLGYAGGATGTSNNCDAFQGESYAGLGSGDGDGVCTAYNEYYGHWAANYGGGGAHITGAGGAHASGATDGDSWTGGGATPPYAGVAYGAADLSTLFFGSGGGGVWNGGTDSPGEDPGPGGSGGGIVLIGAANLNAAGIDAVTSRGGTTTHWSWGTWTYGAGGGAGGTVWLIADALTLATGAISAEGGFGEATHIRLGGDGGDGRVRVDCTTCNGATQGSSAATTALEAASVPDPGYSTTPS